MRQTLIIFIITFFSFQTYSQLYKSTKGWHVYFIEIKQDSTHIEFFYNSPPDFVINDFNKIFFLSDTLIDNSIELLPKKGRYLLRYKKPNYNGTKKIHLKPCYTDDRAIIRNKSYSSDKRVQMMNFQDSLSGPELHIHMDINNIYRKIDLNLSEIEYKEIVDKITDSLKIVINQLKNPVVDLYFQKADSISKLDSMEINVLLLNADYKFQYGNYLLYKVAIDRPESLINYIDSNPENSELILRTIRNHDNYKKITEQVKGTELSSKGKKKIVKQESKRKMTDIGTGTAYVTLILVELAAFTALGIWIF